MPTLLQIELSADTLSTASSESIPVSSVSESAISLIDMLVKGGYIMIPIAILFTVAIYIFIERFISIRRATVKDGNFMQNIQLFIENNNTNKALELCRETNLPIARMIEKGIKRMGGPVKEVEEAIEIEGKFEVTELEKGLPILAVIAGIAPMFGFLGTIIGVIKIFFDISQTADVSIGVVSAGLYVKMVSSAAGLVVGIMAYIFYNWLNIKVGKAINKMERNAMNFIEFLKDSGK
jgi:biopolymer transport protein ExbB